MTTAIPVQIGQIAFRAPSVVIAAVHDHMVRGGQASHAERDILCVALRHTQRASKRRLPLAWPPSRGELDLPDRGEFEIRVRGVLANADHGIAQKVIGWERKVVGRRHTVKHAPRQIIFGAMARTKIAARPVHRRRSRVRLRLKERDASEMRANTNDDAEVRFD